MAQSQNDEANSKDNNDASSGKGEKMQVKTASGSPKRKLRGATKV